MNEFKNGIPNSAMAHAPNQKWLSSCQGTGCSTSSLHWNLKAAHRITSRLSGPQHAAAVDRNSLCFQHLERSHEAMHKCPVNISISNLSSEFRLIIESINQLEHLQQRHCQNPRTLDPGPILWFPVPIPPNQRQRQRLRLRLRLRLWLRWLRRFRLQSQLSWGLEVVN